MKKYVFLSIFCTLIAPQIGYSISAPIQLEHISTQDGLSQSVVWELTQDKAGYLWIGTEEGLNRYDAYDVRPVNGPTDAFNAAYITLLYTDKEGETWVSGGRNKNYRYQPETESFTAVTLPKGMSEKTSAQRITEVYEDNQNNLWLISLYQVYQYDRASDQYSYLFQITDLPGNVGDQDIIRSIYRIKNYLLIGTSVGLFSYDLKNRVFRKLNHTIAPPNSDENNVKGIFNFNQGYIYIATVEGLYRITLNSIMSSLERNEEITADSIYEVNASRNIWHMIDYDDTIYAATDNGLYFIDENNKLSHLIRYSDTPYQLYDNDITRLFVDREENLWLSSREDGFFKWRPNRAVTGIISNQRGTPQRLPSNNVYAMRKLDENHLLIGTTHGLAKYNLIDDTTEQYFVNKDEKSPFSDESIYQIFTSPSRTILHRTKGIKLLNKNDQSEVELVLTPEQTKRLNKTTYFVSPVDEDNLLVLQDEDVFLFNVESGEFSEIEGLTQQKGDNAFQFILKSEPSTNQLFFAKYNSVVTYDRTTQQTKVLHELKKDDSTQAVPQSILKVDNQYWINYSGLGLYIVDVDSSETLKIIPPTELNTSNFLDVFTYDENFVWVTSNDGLIKINRENYSNQKFSKTDGLISNEFIGGTTVNINDDNWAFGTTRGVVFIDLQRLDIEHNHVINVMPSKVSLLSKGNRNYSDANTIELEYDDFGLNIEYSARLFNKTEQVKYDYWIEGDSATQITSTFNNTLLFPKFKPGKSKLYIAAVDYTNGELSEPYVLSIVNHPAPWLSPIALTTYVLVALAIISTIGYQRYRRQKYLLQTNTILASNEERLQLALNGSNSGMWDWHAKNDEIFEPRLNHLVENENDAINLSEKINFIHPDDKDAYSAKWRRFLSQPDSSFEHVYRLKNQQDEWCWYRDLAKVTEVNSNKDPIRVTGTFTDITDTKSTQDKMDLFFEAFDNTRDIIIILDKVFNVKVTNHSFFNTTGIDLNEVVEKPLSVLVNPDSQLPIAQTMKHRLESNNEFETEGLVLRKYQEPLSVLVSVNKFKNNDSEVYYVISATDISEQKAAQEELKRLANYDPLTGLPNRALLMDRITHAIENGQRRKQMVAVFFIDLDRFKQVNDSLGHEVGDRLLIAVSGILKSAVRRNDTVARLGGDEFVVMLEDIYSIDTASRIANTILEKMASPLTIGEHEVNSSPSIGISVFPDDGSEANIILKHADMAMYHAKNSGRNNFKYFIASMNDEAINRMSMEKMIREGIKNNEFTLLYQPQIDLHTNKIAGFEALARWQRSNNEIISPIDFIPVAEEIGLIIPLTEQLIELALETLQLWHSHDFEIGLAVNLSARHFKQNDFDLYMKERLAHYQIQPGALEFELTESMLMTDMEVALTLIRKLKKIGIDLALDDFGTGYSSLKYLHQLPIEKLKIDRSFVARIGEQKEAETIIKTIIDLAKSLQKTSVVEGVETAEQLDFVREFGADSVQGYYFAKPMSREETIEFIKHHQE
ncbi:MAG: EAL domain-containing protein [Gammaproteobacteria bacterium]|nr:EAL domain-containing protein [Gammaproteobacteria bacterium]